MKYFSTFLFKQKNKKKCIAWIIFRSLDSYRQTVYILTTTLLYETKNIFAIESN